jgi:hypothetical protein
MVKSLITRLVQMSLGLHGVLHIAELGAALYEEAYIAASLAGFATLTMILGAILLEPEERAHHH